MPDGNGLGFAVIGCGTAAVPVCAAIAASPTTELVMVQDANPAMARDLSERLKVRRVDSVEQVLSEPAVGAVYIAVPHHVLAPLAAQALAAGKHVLVEKPMAIRVAEADALIALAEEHTRTLDVFFQMRGIGPYAQAKALVRARAIGDIIGVRIQTLIDKRLAYWQVGYAGRSQQPWRAKKEQAGGGVVLMNTSHALDAVQHITGHDVVSVSAEIATLVADVEVEDTAAATLRFDNGAVGSLFAGAHIAGAEHAERIELYGTRGQIRLPDPYGADALRVYLREPWADLAAARWHTLPSPPTDVYATAVEAFAHTIRSGPPTTAGARNARQTLATVLAIYHSAAERRTIQVPVKR